MNLRRTALTAAALLITTAAFAQAPQGVEALAGKPAPAFKMTDLNGKLVTNESLKGKVVLIDFWATWCGPCLKAAPSLQALHAKYGKDGLVVIGANTFERTEDKVGPAKAYQKEHGYGYLFTVNNDDLARNWGVRGIPTMILIGRDGVVQKVQVGFGDGTDKVLEAIVKDLVAAPVK